MKHPAELSFEETCKLELKLKEQEAIIKTLREESLYWRLLLREFCDNMDRNLIEEYKNESKRTNRTTSEI
jgi:virulence-associated protein VagC